MENPERGFNFELKATKTHQTADYQHVYVLPEGGWVNAKEFEWLSKLLPVVRSKQPNSVQGKRTGEMQQKDPATHSSDGPRRTWTWVGQVLPSVGHVSGRKGHLSQ